MRYFTVSRDDSVYEAFPDVIRAGERLVCVFTECDRHAPRTWAKLMLTHSLDRGETWSQKKEIPMSGLAYLFDCARLTLHDGVLYCVCGAHETETGKNCFTLSESRDLGETWGAPRILHLEGIMPDKLVFMPDGRWLLPAQRRKADDPSREEEILYISADQGKTWETVVIASVPNLWLCEGNLLPLPAGALACVMRENSSEGYDGYKTLSFDGGRTWGEAHRMPLPGLHRPSCMILNDGRVLITYRFMQGGKGWLGSWTQNAFAALTDVESMLSEDRRGQWARIMPIFFDRSSKSDIGYTSCVQFDDGEILTVTYLVDDAPKAFIKGVSFREEDMLIQTPDF